MINHVINFWLVYKAHFMRDGRLLETQNASLSIVIGIDFILNGLLKGNLYERFPATYHYMAFAPSYVWGALYAAFGVLHLMLLYTNFHWFRKQVILVKCGLWIFLALCTLSADFFAPSGWMFLVLSYSAAVTFLRLGLTKEGFPTHDNINDDLAHN